MKSYKLYITLSLNSAFIRYYIYIVIFYHIVNIYQFKEFWSFSKSFLNYEYLVNKLNALSPGTPKVAVAKLCGVYGWFSSFKGPNRPK